MSDKPISVDDLVMVVRPSFCAGETDGIGHVFLVSRVYQDEEEPQRVCAYCGRVHMNGEMFAEDATLRCDWAVRRLMKIPPLTEPGHVHTIEELTA